MLAAGLSRFTKVEEHSRRAIDSIALSKRRFNQPKKPRILSELDSKWASSAKHSSRFEYTPRSSHIHLYVVELPLALDELVNHWNLPWRRSGGHKYSEQAIGVSLSGVH